MRRPGNLTHPPTHPPIYSISHSSPQTNQPPTHPTQIIAHFLEPERLVHPPTLYLLLNLLPTAEAEDFRALFLSPPALNSLLLLAFGWVDGRIKGTLEEEEEEKEGG